MIKPDYYKVATYHLNEQQEKPALLLDKRWSVECKVNISLTLRELVDTELILVVLLIALAPSSGVLPTSNLLGWHLQFECIAS